MKFDVVIFDLDDTLLIQEESNREVLNRFIEELLKKYSGASEFRASELTGQFLLRGRELWRALESEPLCRNLGISSGEGLWGDFDSPGEAMGRLRQETQIYRLKFWSEVLESCGQDPSDAQELGSRFIAEKKRIQTWLPGAQDILEHLQGRFKLSLLTNGASDLQWFKIRSSSIDKYFDQIVVSGDVGVGKPNPEIYRHLTQSHPAGTRFVMVGNSLNSDIRGASAAGIPCIWLDWEGEKLPEDLKPWKTIESLVELKDILD